MKTILILASILTLQFMIATNDVDAQNKKSSLPEITDAHMPEALARQLATDDRFERNKSCQLCGNGEPYTDLTTRSVDLNGDGNPEWLMSYCGNRTRSGWIYRKVGNRYESIMPGYIGDVSYISVPGSPLLVLIDRGRLGIHLDIAARSYRRSCNRRSYLHRIGRIVASTCCSN